jgi:hypothetical protein
MLTINGFRVGFIIEALIAPTHLTKYQRFFVAFRRATAGLALCAVLSGALGAQPVAVRQKGSVKLSARPTLIDGELRWKLISLPAPGDFEITDAAVKARVREALRELSEDPDCTGRWLAESGVDCSFPGKLAGKLVTDLGFVVLTQWKSPSAESDPPPNNSQLRFQYKAGPSAAMESLAIEVTTDEAMNDPGNAIRLERTQGQTTLVLRYHPGEIELGKDKLESALAQEANAARVIAESMQVAPGKPIRQDLNDRVADSFAERYWRSAAWPAPKVGTIQQVESGKYRWQITGVRVARAAQIAKPQKGPYVGSEESLDRILVAAEKKINADAAAELKALEGKVPTLEAVNAVLKKMNDSRLFLGMIETKIKDRDLVFETRYRWTISTLNAKVAMQVGYDPQELLTGQTEISSDNLLHWRETMALSFKGGQEVQNANYTLNLTRMAGQEPKARVEYGFELRAFYSRDRNQRLQNPLNTYLADEERGVVPRIFANLHHGTRIAHALRAEAFLDFRHVLLESREANTPAVVDGQLSAVNAAVQDGLIWAAQPSGDMPPRSGLAKAAVRFDGRVTRGLTALAGDFDFTQYAASLTGETYWGSHGREDFLIRYTRGVGGSSSTTPIFKLFRLGGQANIRGIEEGEFIGRQLGFDQSEAGVSLPLILSLFKSKNKEKEKPPSGETEEAAAPKPSPLAALGISSAFIKGFFDRGRVTNSSSFGGMWNLADALKGYGVAVELQGLKVGNRRANLSIGYARSSQSVIHKKGLVSTTLFIDF